MLGRIGFVAISGNTLRREPRCQAACSEFGGFMSPSSANDHRRHSRVREIGRTVQPDGPELGWLENMASSIGLIGHIHQVMNLSYTPRRFVPLPPAVLPPPGQPTTDPIMTGAKLCPTEEADVKPHLFL